MNRAGPLAEDARAGRAHGRRPHPRVRRAHAPAVRCDGPPGRARELAELLALPRLKPGESAAPVGERVEPVPQAHVDAVIPFPQPVLRARVELQWIAGMRSGEVCQMTTAMLDRRAQTWVYQPGERKTKWRNWNSQIVLPALSARMLEP